MNANEKLLDTFYKAFQNKDYATMQSCYADHAVFNDAVFKNLSAMQVRAMWEMLIKRGKDLRLEFSNIQANHATGRAEWVASYSFSSTKRKVVNRIKADFIFENGKIVKHTDHFNFYKWSRQALGLTGLLAGWTPFLHNKVSRRALEGLQRFMENE